MKTEIKKLKTNKQYIQLTTMLLTLFTVIICVVLTIEITSLNYSAATTRTVVAGVSLDKTSIILGIGENYKLTSTTTPSNENSSVTWSSSNTSVAMVKSGMVTAKSTGVTTIKATTKNGKTASCKVTVKFAPNSVNLNTSSATLGVGENFQISECTNNGSYANADNLKWSSSNPNVATVKKGVSNKATITAKGTGTTTVKITLYNGKTASCKITVKPAPTSVTINPSNLILGVGEKYTISESTNSGSYANSSNLEWSNSNSNVVTFTKGSANKATLTAKKSGTSTIKITLYNGITATCKVTVKSAPSSVKINPTSFTLGMGETCTVSETTNSGSYANASFLKWSSSDSNIVSVAKGIGNKANLTAKSTGTAKITITLYNGRTAACNVTVKSAPTSVNVNPSNLTLYSGESYTISEYTNSGSYANASNLNWSSSNLNVAEVTKGSGNKAIISAKSKGKATVTIKLYNGKTACCNVKVKIKATSLDLNTNSVTDLKVGDSCKLSYTLSPLGCEQQNIFFTSSDSDIVSVDNSGQITGKSIGSAIITAKTSSGLFDQCIVNVVRNLDAEFQDLLKTLTQPLSMNTAGSTRALYVDDKYLYHCSNAKQAVSKVDISDESAPTLVKTVGGHAKVYTRGMAAGNGYLYVPYRDQKGGTFTSFDSDTDIGGYLDIINLNDFTLKNTITYSRESYNPGDGNGTRYYGKSHNAATYNDKYLCVTQQIGGWLLYGISTTPDNPTLLYKYDNRAQSCIESASGEGVTEFQKPAFYTDGTTVYLAISGYDRDLVKIYDLSTPDAPVCVYTCNIRQISNNNLNQATNHTMGLVCNFPYIYCTVAPLHGKTNDLENTIAGVAVLNVSNINNVQTKIYTIPNEYRTVNAGGETSPQSIAITKNHLIMDNFDKGISVWSLSNPSQPDFLGNLDTGATKVCSVLSTDDGRAFVGTEFQGGNLTMYRGL